MKNLILPLMIASLAHAEELDVYTISVLRWTPLATLEPASVKVNGFLPFTAGRIPKVIRTHKMSSADLLSRTKSLLTGSPSRVVYEIPKDGYRAFKGRVTLRDYEVTYCVFKIFGDGKLLWESPPVQNEGKGLKSSASL
jgi:hypothetical protein